MAVLFDHTGFDLSVYTVRDHQAQPGSRLYLPSYQIRELTKPSPYQVPAAFVLLFAPHMYAVQLAGKNHDLTIRGKTVQNVTKDESIPKKVSFSEVRE